jgi:hypothetical protein
VIRAILTSDARYLRHSLDSSTLQLGHYPCRRLRLLLANMQHLIADLLVEMNGRVGQPSKQLVATSREVIRTLVTAMLITLLPTTI